jgi:hypothetical protein
MNMQANGLARAAIFLSFVFGIAFPTYAQSTRSASRISDVALGTNGRLEGQVVDYQGRAMSNVPVSIKSEGVQPIATTTTEDGRFAYEGLSGGVYQVASKNGDYTTVRAWTPEAAPPQAKAQAVLYMQEVPQTQTVTTNNYAGGTPRGMGGLRSLLANPIVLPAAIATAIAVPIALSSHSTPASP